MMVYERCYVCLMESMKHLMHHIVLAEYTIEGEAVVFDDYVCIYCKEGYDD